MNDQWFNFFAVAVLAGWIPLIFVLFAVMPARRAVITAFVFGYLFLPEGGYTLHTLPDITKVSLTAFGVVLASLIFDGGRLFRVRPKLIDLAWVALMVSPTITSLMNGLGLMDGLDASANLLFRWGLAYWIGRAYFTDWESVRELAMGIVLGAIAYVPLCWWEIRMSPQLHRQIYGVLFNSFRTDTYLFGVRLFGFRPNVFLANGLTVTMYMGIASVLAYWAWMTGSPKRLLGVPMGLIVITLVITAIFCKAVGGMVLMTCGIAALTLVRWPKTRLAALILIFAAPFYMIVRTGTDWSGDFLVEAASAVSHMRADSLEFRLKNEDLLAEKALQRPFFGWGGWTRSHVYDINGNDVTIADGLWVITLGEYGFVGLGAFTLLAVGCAFMVWRQIPRRFWTDPACAAAVALAVVIGMYMVDSLFNATFNPVASLTIGALASIAGVARKTFAQVAAPVRAMPARPPAFGAVPVAVRSVKDVSYGYPAYRS